MEQLLVGINAQDNATPVLEKFKKSITQVTSSFDDVNKGADKFGSSMLEQAKKLPGISDSVGLLGKSLDLLKSPFLQIPVLAGAAVTSMIAFANSNMKTVTELKRMSETTGISVNALAALKKVGQQTETSFESIVGAVTKLEKNLGESGKSFKKLGVEGREPLTVLASLADRFKATTDPVDRARLGFLAFGKTWKDMAPMLAEGGDAIRKAAEATTISEAMVVRYEKLHRDQLAISNAAGAWKSALGDLASGPLALVTGMLADMAKKSADVAKNIRSAINKEADADVAAKWLHGSDEEVQAYLKNLQKMANSGQKIDPSLSRNIGPMRDKWARENWSKADESTKESIANSIKTNDPTRTVFGDLSEETKQKFLADVEELKKRKDKILNQGSTDDGKSKLDAELRLSEMYQKAKSQLDIDSTKDELERAKKVADQEYQTKVNEANKAFSAIKGASKTDKENLNSLLQTLETDHQQKILNIQDKFAEDALRKKIKVIDDQLKAQEKAAKQANDIIKLANEALLDNITDEKEKELKVAELKYEEDLRAYSDNEKAKIIIANRYNGQIQAIDKKFRDKETKEYKDQFKFIGDTMSKSLNAPFSDFLKQVTRGNQSLVSSFKNMGRGIKDAMGNALVEMVADWTAKKAGMYAMDFAMYVANGAKTLAASLGFQAAAVTEATATGAAIAAAQAPAAGLTSIATMGGADVAASTGLASTMALALSFAANGTNYSPGGWTMVGERGPEIVNMPRGAQVIPNNQITGNSTQNINIQMNNTGATVKDISREFQRIKRANDRTMRKR